MKRLIFKGILLLVLTASTYYVLAIRLDMAPAIQNQNYKLKRMRKTENFPILIMGDSRALAMNRSGAKGVYNYAMTYYYGLSPLPYLLRKYLKHNQPPKVIILSIIPESFGEKQDFTISPTSARLFTLREILSDPQLRKDKKKLREMLVNRFDINQFYANSYDRSLFNPDTGFLIFRRDFHYKKVFLLFYDDQFRMEPISMQHLDEFFKLTRENNIRVIVYFMPISGPAYDIPKFYNEMQRRMPQIAARFPEAYFVKPYPKDDLYPMDYTIDGTHLNEKGAIHFNETKYKQLLALSHLLAENPETMSGLDARIKKMGLPERIPVSISPN